MNQFEASITIHCECGEHFFAHIMCLESDEDEKGYAVKEKCPACGKPYIAEAQLYIHLDDSENE